MLLKTNPIPNGKRKESSERKQRLDSVIDVLKKKETISHHRKRNKRQSKNGFFCSRTIENVEFSRIQKKWKRQKVVRHNHNTQKELSQCCVCWMIEQESETEKEFQTKSNSEIQFYNKLLLVLPIMIEEF